MSADSENEKRWLLVALTSCGLALSLFLEFLHVRTYLSPSSDSFCSVNSNFDCATVAASPTSIFLGIPWAIWGSLGFFVLLVAALRRSRWLVPLSLLAAVVSVVLLVVELTAIGSVCLFCEGVHVISWVLAGVAFWRRRELIRPWRDGTTLYLLFVLPFSVALTLWLFLPSYWSAFSFKTQPPFSTGKTSEGHPWIGAVHPTVTVDEFTDYRCPHCRVGSARSLRWLDEYPGLRVVRRQQPGTQCRPGGKSCWEVRLAYCAEEQGQFWRADRWLFAQAGQRGRVDLQELASALDLDAKKLAECSRRPDIYTRADQEAAFARKKRLIDTPSYLVEGKKVSLQNLEAAVEARR